MAVAELVELGEDVYWLVNLKEFLALVTVYLDMDPGKNCIEHLSAGAGRGTRTWCLHVVPQKILCWKFRRLSHPRCDRKAGWHAQSACWAVGSSVACWIRWQTETEATTVGFRSRGWFPLSHNL